MTKPPILDGLPVVEQTRLRPCGHGLTGRRVRQDLFRCVEDACFAARRRVLDGARIFKPERGLVEDQVLVARPYGEAPRDVAEDVALYAAGFDAGWLVVPSGDGRATVVIARRPGSHLLQAIAAAHPAAITEANL